MLNYSRFQALLDEFSQEYNNTYNGQSLKIIYDTAIDLHESEFGIILLRLQKNKSPHHMALPAPMCFINEISRFIEEKKEASKQREEARLLSVQCRWCFSTGSILAALKKDDLEDILAYKYSFLCYCPHSYKAKRDAERAGELDTLPLWGKNTSPFYTLVTPLIDKQFNGEYKKFREAYLNALFKNNHGLPTKEELKERKERNEKKRKTSEINNIGSCQTVSNVLKGSSVN